MLFPFRNKNSHRVQNQRFLSFHTLLKSVFIAARDEFLVRSEVQAEFCLFGLLVQTPDLYSIQQMAELYI